MVAKIVELNKVRIDGGTQSRASINTDTVAEYAAVLQGGGTLPALDVFYDGAEYWLADGFHRWHAYQSSEIEKGHCEVRSGTLRDAVLFSVGANAKHGLRRSNDDKRKSVGMLLDDAEWVARSDVWIAEQCGVSDKTVAGLRIEREHGSEIRTSSPTKTRTGRNGVKQPAKRKNRQPKATQTTGTTPVAEEPVEPNESTEQEADDRGAERETARQATWTLQHALEELGIDAKWAKTLNDIRADIEST